MKTENRNTDDFVTLSAVELAQLYERRSLSPVEVIRAVFDRIERANPLINAFSRLDEERALVAARSSEARWLEGRPASELDGVPTSVKDLSLTKDWPTLRGSLLIDAAGPWDEDAPSVARMREAGAVLFGKTTVPEFGAKGVTHSELHGVTRNPWDPNKTPGGSSGGAAAAVAAGMGTLALASDAAGSIRNPSAFSGVFGFKPSLGLVPDSPPSYLGTIAVVGPITRSVHDAATTLNIISKPDRRDPYSVPLPDFDFVEAIDRGIRGCKVAFSPTLGFAHVDPAVAATVADAAAKLEQLGAVVEEVDRVFDDPAAVMRCLTAVGLAHAFDKFGIGGEDHSLVDPNLLEIVKAGRQMTGLDYVAAREAREQLSIHMREFHDTYDLLVTPTLPLTAFDVGLEAPVDSKHIEHGNWRPFSAAFNLTGQPCASVPCGLADDGLPVGMQIVGARYEDALVLRACQSFQDIYPIQIPNLSQSEWFQSPTPTPPERKKVEE